MGGAGIVGGAQDHHELLARFKYHLFINLVARDHTRILYLNPNEQLLKNIHTVSL